jgi:GntR family transcriptional regulator
MMSHRAPDRWRDAWGWAAVTMQLERTSPRALYRQIADAIERDVRARRYPALGRLPSELELMRRFAVSRATVRQAIDLLVAKGLLIRKQGKGTFLRGPEMAHELRALTGIYDVLASAGLPLELELLGFGPAAAPEPPGAFLAANGWCACNASTVQAARRSG